MEGIRCHNCGNIAEPAQVEFHGYSIGGWRCGHCGEEFCDPVESERILLFNKLRRQPLSMKVSEIKEDSVLAVPRAIANLLKLEVGSEVVAHFQDLEHVLLEHR